MNQLWAITHRQTGVRVTGFLKKEITIGASLEILRTDEPGTSMVTSPVVRYVRIFSKGVEIATMNSAYILTRI